MRQGQRKVYNESVLWCMINRYLKNKGFDSIKKRMSRDGHMVNDDVYYIRDRGFGWGAVHDDAYIHALYENYNNGCLRLKLHSWMEADKINSLFAERLGMHEG